MCVEIKNQDQRLAYIFCDHGGCYRPTRLTELPAITNPDGSIDPAKFANICHMLRGPTLNTPSCYQAVDPCPYYAKH